MNSTIDTVVRLRRLQKNLRRSRPELRAIQRAKLKALIHHAVAHVPYYQDLFSAAGIQPSDIQGVEDLDRIPTTSKLKLQSLTREEVLCRRVAVEDCVKDVTSGSTGIPLHVYFSREDYAIRSLIFIRTFMESGYRLTDRQAIVCDTRFVSDKKYWFQNFGIFRKKYIPVQDDLNRQIEILRRYRPDYIHGYPVSIGAIANEMLQRGLDDISPKMVCAGAELLSRKTRETINRAFGVNMVDTYATVESGMIAWECSERRGYHINIDSIVIEFLHNGRPALPGERGRVVITNLHSFAMPIIRYELGDVCILSDEVCACGSEFPLMSIVEGRVDDMIYTPGGKVVSPNSMTNVMEAVEGVSQFRIIQEERAKLLVQLVKGRGFSQKTPEAAVGLLEELVGNEMDVQVQLVDEIPKEHTGKVRAVISKVPKDQQYLN